MDPALAAAGIQAGASLVGGLLGRNKAVKPGDVVRQTAAGIMGQAYGARKYGEMYGFNPMALLGVSQPLVPQTVDNSGMGAAIANAGLAVADGINASTQAKAYTEALEEQNKELRKALDGATLRPKVAGIYGRATPVAGVAEPVAVEDLSEPGGQGFDIASSDTGSGGVPVAPGIPADATPLMQTYTYDGETLTVPAFVDVDELVSGAAAMAAIAYKKATKARVMEHMQMKYRMFKEKAKNDRMVETVRSQGRTQPLGSGASHMPSKIPWWMTR